MIKNMDVKILRSKLDSKENIILIDCREQNEWDQGHIDGAKLYPLSSFTDHLGELSEQKDAEIIIQCRSGKRSMNACQLLESNGFSNLSNLDGGILSWIDQEFPTIK